MEIDIRIDSLTDCLVCTKTGEECDTEYRFDRFGEAMMDGRLTAPSDGKVYRLREAILLSKQLGRILSPDEMKKFEV